MPVSKLRYFKHIGKCDLQNFEDEMKKEFETFLQVNQTLNNVIM